MPDDAITITTSLDGSDEVVSGAAKIVAALKSVSAAAKEASGAVASAAKGGAGGGRQRLDIAGYLDSKKATDAAKAEAAATKNLTAAKKDLVKQAKLVNKELSDFSNTLQQKVVRIVKDSSLAVIGLTAAFAGLGLAGASALEQTALTLQGYGGGNLSQGAAYAQARGLRRFTTGEQSFGAVSSAYQNLISSGANPQQAMGLLGGISQISAVSQDPSGNLQAMSSGLQRVLGMGQIDARSSRTLLNAGLPIYRMIAQHMGLTGPFAERAVRNLIENAGGVIATPWLLGALSNPASDPFLKGFVGGVGRANTQSLRGAGGNLLHQIEYSLSDILTGQTGAGISTFTRTGSAAPGAAGKLAFGIAGLTQGATRDVAKYAPMVMQFVAGLAKYLPTWAKAGEGLLHSLEPLVPAVEHLVNAFMRLGPGFIKFVSAVAGNVAKLVDFFSGIANFVSKSAALRGPVLDVLEAVGAFLLTFRTVSMVLGAGKAVASTIKDLQTIFGAGATAPTTIFANAVTQFQAAVLKFTGGAIAGDAGTAAGAGGLGAYGAGAAGALGVVTLVAGTVYVTHALTTGKDSPANVVANTLSHGRAPSTADKTRAAMLVGANPSGDSTLVKLARGAFSWLPWNHHSSKTAVHAPSHAAAPAPRSKKADIHIEHLDVHVPAGASASAIHGAVSTGLRDGYNAIARDSANRSHVQNIGYTGGS